jgi:hypothetical protein
MLSIRRHIPPTILRLLAQALDAETEPIASANIEAAPAHIMAA